MPFIYTGLGKLFQSEEALTLFKKTIIRIFYSCDGLRGFALNPAGFLCSSQINFFQTLGRIVTEKNKQKRLQAIGSSTQKVSIILPVLNSENTLQRAIESIQSQSYPHWELLIIDDGSTDKTKEIVSQMASEDSRIRLYQNKKNQGVAYARNVGLHYAAGDYITFHDADDTSHVERLEYQVAELLSNTNTKVSIFQYVRVDGKGNTFIINGKEKWNRVSGMMFRKNIIDKIGYFKPLKISEDSEYYERIIATFGKKSRKIICKTLYYALFSPDSLLFSNANVSINGKSVDYKIHDKELLILEAFRAEHKRIRAGELAPYQSFFLDEDVTKYLG